MASMPSDPSPPVVVSLTPEFKRDLRQLGKKYRHVKSDVQPIVDQLQNGEKPGDQIPKVQDEVFKVRVKNTDAKRGKSGGYRIIYYVPQTGKVILVAIYSKTEQEDVSAAEIRQIIEQQAVEATDTSAATDVPRDESEGKGEE